MTKSHAITPIKEYPLAEQVADQTSATNRLAALMPKARERESLLSRVDVAGRTETTTDDEEGDVFVVGTADKKEMESAVGMTPTIETAKTRNEKRRNKRKAAKTGMMVSASPTPPVTIGKTDGYAASDGVEDDGALPLLRQGVAQGG